MELTSTVGLLLVAAVSATPVDSRDLDERELPGRVQALVAQISENGDRSESEVTSAGWELIEMGMPALRHGALDLIASDDPDTRRRGAYVLTGIVTPQFGFVPGRGWLDLFGQERFNELWATYGIDERAVSEPQRRECYEQWKAWAAMAEEPASRTHPNRLRPPQVDPPTASAR